MGPEHAYGRFVIRRYEPSDLESVVDAWYEASLVAHPFLPDAFFVEERRLLAEEWLPVAETYVVEVDEHAVGFVAFASENEIGGLFVHPSHQGSGCGRALVDHAVELKTWVELEVFEENAIGRRFYDRYGFHQVGESIEPTTGRPQLRLRYD